MFVRLTEFPRAGTRIAERFGSLKPIMNIEPEEPFFLRAEDAAQTQYDTIIIGGGQGGALARMLGEGGQTVLVIEREAMGGTCVNRGCTPTKAHIASAKRAQDARDAAPLGIVIPRVEVNMPAVQARTACLVKDFREGVEHKLSETQGVSVLGATARFVGKNKLEAKFNDGKTLGISAPNIIIATGAHTVAPPIDGLDNVDWVDHRGMLQLETVPDHLLILGGGYIACEFSQMFKRLGSEVTLVQSGPQLLDREDEPIARAMADLLTDSGIELICDDKCQAVKSVDGGIEATLESGKNRPGHAALFGDGAASAHPGFEFGANRCRVERIGTYPDRRLPSSRRRYLGVGRREGWPGVHPYRLRRRAYFARIFCCTVASVLSKIGRCLTWCLPIRSWAASA